MGKTVLIVEDDADTRDLIGEILEGEGYQVHSAADGEQALALLEGGLRPGVVLLDLLMPRKDGASLLGSIHRDPRFENVRVVITSASPDRAPTDAWAFLGKPFELEDLLCLLALAFGEPSAPGPQASAQA